MTIVLSACPSGWTYSATFGKCYYHLSDSGRTWNAANSQCAAVDPDGVATLTSIGSASENAYIQSLISGGGGAWIGGNDITVEGVWRWVNSCIQ